MTADTQQLFDRCLLRDRVALGRAMTLIESRLPADRAEAVRLLGWCEDRIRQSSGAVRLAISGAPGAGKSTLIEALGQIAIRDGRRLGVITVDPSSSLSRGSILGDKARMTALSNAPEAFIRSSPAGEILGGLARRTMELMTLLEAAGFDLILLETVGVGQSEHLAWEFTDGFVLVVQPGAGDELQGVKRGITELADLVLVNKADGDLRMLARTARAHYTQALHYLSAPRADRTPQVLACSAQTGEGLPEAWQALKDFAEWSLARPDRSNARRRQQQRWLEWSVRLTAQELLLHHPALLEKLKAAAAGSESGIFQAEFEIGQLMHNLIRDPSRLSS